MHVNSAIERPNAIAIPFRFFSDLTYDIGKHAQTAMISENRSQDRITDSDLAAEPTNFPTIPKFL